MKSEEEQYVSTGNQLHYSDATPEDARCTPADIIQNRVSSNSQSPIGPPTCGRVASVSQVKQSSDDYQVWQGIHYEGLTSIESEDHPAKINSQEGFLPFDQMRHQNNRRLTDYCEPDIQVKSEKIEPDECNSNSAETRKLAKERGGLDQEEREVTYKEVKTIVYHKEKTIWLKQHPSYNSENSFYQLSRENQAIMVRLRTAWTLLGSAAHSDLRTRNRSP
ncbi:hypothetical protein LSAT2_009821 [Lamellibrachia satsuma]|nr:hypothetical protein LSAT2_009821 [Lamellibrachia satsuma]